MDGKTHGFCGTVMILSESGNYCLCKVSFSLFSFANLDVLNNEILVLEVNKVYIFK